MRAASLFRAALRSLLGKRPIDAAKWARHVSSAPSFLFVTEARDARRRRVIRLSPVTRRDRVRRFPARDALSRPPTPAQRPRVNRTGRAVSVWHAYRGDEERALHEVLRDYERIAGVEVDVLAVPYEAYGAKLAAAVPRGHGPDVFIEAHERLGPYLRDLLVAPAGDAFPDEDLTRFDATSIEAVTKAGIRYGVPLASKCLALYVNDRLVPREIAELEAAVRARGLAARRLPARLRGDVGVFPRAVPARLRGSDARRARATLPLPSRLRRARSPS